MVNPILGVFLWFQSFVSCVPAPMMAWILFVWSVIVIYALFSLIWTLRS